jgi:hypothetical protein
VAAAERICSDDPAGPPPAQAPRGGHLATSGDTGAPAVLLAELSRPEPIVSAVTRGEVLV